MSLQFLKDSLDNQNVKAFLKTIRESEGTDAPDGYNYLFGSSPRNGRRFTDFSKHPNIHEPFGNQTSSAAGAFQIMHETDLGLTQQLVLMGLSLDQAQMFDEPTQRLKCALLLSNHNCLQKTMDGNLNYIVGVLNKTWASLPGSPYGQPVHTMLDVDNWYTGAGGIIND